MAKKFNPKESRTLIVSLKIYFDRARMYLGYINFFMLNLVLINSFGEGRIGDLLKEYQHIFIPLLILFYILLLLFIGYLDTRLGLRQEEMRNNASVNPVMQDLLKSIDEIKADVKHIKTKG